MHTDTYTYTQVPVPPVYLCTVHTAYPVQEAQVQAYRIQVQVRPRICRIHLHS
jgi:hypothetical protein